MTQGVQSYAWICNPRAFDLKKSTAWPSSEETDFYQHLSIHFLVSLYLARFLILATRLDHRHHHHHHHQWCINSFLIPGINLSQPVMFRISIPLFGCNSRAFDLKSPVWSSTGETDFYSTPTYFFFVSIFYLDSLFLLLGLHLSSSSSIAHKLIFETWHQPLAACNVQSVICNSRAFDLRSPAWSSSGKTDFTAPEPKFFRFYIFTRSGTGSTQPREDNWVAT